MKNTVNIKYLSIAIILLASFAQNIKAQDVHFSQNYATPLYINPAMTGLMKGDFRAAIVYRNQWGAAMGGSPFRTMYGAADMTLDGLGEYDRLAFGIMLYNDKAGDLNYHTNYGDIALAYNVGLSEHAFLSLGLTGGIAQRGFDLTNAQFGSQSDGVQYVPGMSSGENFASTGIWRANLGAGVMFYNAFDERNNFFLGGGMYHVTQPDVVFTDNSTADSQIQSKLSVQAGGSVAVAKTVDIVPTVYFLKQGPHVKTEAGAFARFILTHNRHTGLDKAFNIGAFTRMGSSVDGSFGLNSLILATRLEYNEIGVGVSYDLNLSDISAASGRGGIEVAVTYTTQLRDHRKRSNTMVCPSF